MIKRRVSGGHREAAGRPAQAGGSICRWDRAIKIGVPAALALCLALSWRVGSWEAYWQLFQTRTYTASLTGIVAGYTSARCFCSRG